MISMSTNDIDFIDDWSQYIQVVEVDPTGLCNLKCKFCPRATFWPNENKHMTIDTAKKIVEHLKEIDYREEISITGKGEPTLHNNFVELVETFYDPQWQLKMNTNGHRKFHQHEDFILEHFALIHYNCYESEQQFHDVYLKYRTTSNVQVKYRPEMEWYQDHTRYTNRAGSFDMTETIRAEGVCDIPFKKMFIDYDGIYRLCCEDWAEYINMGNIWDQSIVQYLNNNAKLKQYRDTLIEGNRLLSPCNKCTYSIDHNKRPVPNHERMQIWKWMTKTENLGV